MSKIPWYYDSPVDNILNIISDSIDPLFKITGHTPNMITTYSLICAIIGIYKLNENKVNTSIIFIILSYFFDVMDGRFARKYDMITKIGDYYDHITDILLYIGIIFIIIKNYKIKVVHISIFIISLSLMTVHFGCQQNMIDDEYKQENEFLDTFKPMCPNNGMIKYTKIFGNGTFVLINILLIKYISLYNK